MNGELKIALESPEGEGLQFIGRKLTEYNASKAGGETPDYLFLTARDEAGEIRGGLVAGTYLGWLLVQMLWVDEAVRGQGVGSRLLDAAEAEAVRRGCPRAFLETLSFQARPFYEKRGYRVFSTLADFPPGGGARYALTKML